MKSNFQLIIFFTLLPFFSFSTKAQVIFQYDFRQDLSDWHTGGNVQLSHVSSGALTPGAARLEVDSVDGNIAHVRFYNDYHAFSGYTGKMLVVKVYAKADTAAMLRIKAELHRNGTYRAVRTDYTLSTQFEKYILPVRILPGDTDIRIHLQIGNVATVYTFDDISFEYISTNPDQWRQHEPQRNARFYYDPSAPTDTLPRGPASVVVRVDTSIKTAPVLTTQIGVNANFRSGDGIVNRSHLYKPFGALRFPAGSGSDMYFWDGNVPSYLNGYAGTDRRFTDPEHFARLKDSVSAQAGIVVNYAYARLGQTPDSSRAGRVAQAAGYAAGFVRKMNRDLQANCRYWEVGNESYGPWEPGYNVNGNIITGKEYGEDFRVFVDSMKAADSTIKVGAVLSHNRYYWNKEVLEQVSEKADYLIFHHYFNNIQTPDGMQKALQDLEDDMDELRLFAAEYTSKPYGYFPLNMTEFNSQGYPTTTMANAIFITRLIATLIEKRVNLADIWVNEWNMHNFETHGILSKGDTLQADYTPRPAYMPFYYYSKYFGSQMVEASVAGDERVAAYASIFDSGETGLVITHLSDTLQSVRIRWATPSDYDVLYRYEIYADNIDYGNTKFYVNGQTSSTPGGGPQNPDSIAPIRYSPGDTVVLTLRPYSINFLVWGHLPRTTIRSQPDSLDLCEGDTLRLSVEADGQNLHYQWQKDGSDIPTANAPEWIIPSADTTDAGMYQCYVTGDFGNVWSRQVRVDVRPATAIVSQPQDLQVTEGDTAVFGVAARGSQLHYQWRHDGHEIAGAVSDTLTILGVQSSDAGYYDVRITGDCGEVMSRPALLNVQLGVSNLQKHGIYLYPNPFYDYIYLKGADEHTVYTLSTPEGKLLSRGTPAAGGRIDISEKWPVGIYILHVEQGQAISYFRIIKIR